MVKCKGATILLWASVSQSINEMPHCCGQLGFFAPHPHGTAGIESPAPRRGSNP
jgi:hypothetical protein